MLSTHSLGSFKRMLMMLFVVVGMMATASTVRADPITVGGPWIEFSFGGPGSSAAACTTCVPSSGGNSVYAGVPPWTFTLGAEGGFLTITDAFLIGDAFDVYDFGVLIGSTPSVAQEGDCGDDPVPCLANPNVSHAVFSLTSGNHSITIIARDSPFGGGAAYFRVDTNAIPEPATMLLLGSGLVTAVGVVRRRRKSTG